MTINNCNLTCRVSNSNHTKLTMDEMKTKIKIKTTYDKIDIRPLTHTLTNTHAYIFKYTHTPTHTHLTHTQSHTHTHARLQKILSLVLIIHYINCISIKYSFKYFLNNYHYFISITFFSNEHYYSLRSAYSVSGFADSD